MSKFFVGQTVRVIGANYSSIPVGTTGVVVYRNSEPTEPPLVQFKGRTDLHNGDVSDGFRSPNDDCWFFPDHYLAAVFVHTEENFFRTHEHLRDRKIELMREYRSVFGAGIKEAKDAVEAHLAKSLKAAPAKKHWIIAVFDPFDGPLPAKKPVIHLSAEDARREARRLSSAERTKLFVVYEATDVMVAEAFVAPPAVGFRL